MSGIGPANATIGGDGFRFYRWEPAEGGDPVDLLSVTSIRRLVGEPHPLVGWQINNVIDTVMGTVKRPAIGKRGKPLKSKSTYAVEEFPSEFVQRYLEADGAQPKMDDLRKWIRDTSDEPKNIAGVRGTIVHKGIERNIAADRVLRPWVEATFADLSLKDKAKVARGVLDEDVAFVHAGMRSYWDMRQKVPFVIIAREPQVFNLAMGYGGSADVIIWFLPEGATAADIPKAHATTRKIVESIGGTLAVGDWKTSKGVYTDQVVQVHAYGAGEFVGQNGVVDHRLTELLQATTRGVLFHIRPNRWAVHRFEFTEEVFTGFAGSVAFARLLAKYPKPFRLFAENDTGTLPDEEDPEGEESE